MRRPVLPGRRLKPAITGPGVATRDCALRARLARLWPGGAAAAGLVWSGPAYAHSLSSRFGDFYGGLLHPLSALEHVLPILALGLLAGQQGPRAARWLLLIFPLAMLIGAGLATIVPALPGMGLANVVSFAVLGLLVAAAWRMPLALLLVLGALFGLSHGYENGRAITPETAAHLFVLGVGTIGAIATALVGAATVALVARAAWPGIAVRIAGSWIAAIGIMMIGLTWRPT